MYWLKCSLEPIYIIPWHLFFGPITSAILVILTFLENLCDELHYCLQVSPLWILELSISMILIRMGGLYLCWPLLFWINCIIAPEIHRCRRIQKTLGTFAYPRRYMILSAYQLGHENSNAILFQFKFSLLGPFTLMQSLTSKWSNLISTGYPNKRQLKFVTLLIMMTGHIFMMSHIYKTIKNQPKKLFKPCAYTSVFDAFASAQKKGIYHSIFDNDTVIVDNSVTVHVCNGKSYFSGPLRSVGSVIRTIDQKPVKITQMGSVEWSWKDDSGDKHTYILHDVAYFPSAPVNLLSLTCFAKQLADPEGTRIDTGLVNSIFTWDNGQYTRTIYHPITRLAELPINESFMNVRNLHRKLASSSDPKFTGTTTSTRNVFFALGEEVYVRTDNGDTTSGRITHVNPDPGTLIAKYTVKETNGGETVYAPEDIWPVHEPSRAFIAVCYRCNISFTFGIYGWAMRVGISS